MISPYTTFDNSSLGHAALHCDGAFHRVNDARKLDQSPIPHQLHDAAVMLSNRGGEQLLTQRLERGERAGVVLAH